MATILVYMVFAIICVWMLLMVFIERVIVNGTLSKTTGEKTELAYTEKKRLGNLELYRKITSDRGQSQIWYKVLYLSYKSIGKAMVFLLLLAAVALLF